SPLLALADLAAARRDLALALRWLDELCQRPALENTVEWRLSQARRIAWTEKPGGTDEAKWLASATQRIEALSPADQGRVLRVLVGLERSRGDLRGALRLCRRWCELIEYDLGARLVLFDLSAEAGEQATMSKAVNELRRSEGEEGVRWRCGEVVRLLASVRWSGGASSQKGEKNGGGPAKPAERRRVLTEARRLLKEAEQLQPGWGRVTF